jgi:hypothetical protein
MVNEKLEFLIGRNEKLLPVSSAEFKERLDHTGKFTEWDRRVHLTHDSELSKEKGRDFWIVNKSFKYYLNEEKTEWVLIPEGFATDGATVIFKPLSWILHPLGRHTRAVVVHDVLCMKHQIYKNDDIYLITQRRADKIMLDILKLDKNPLYKCYGMYIFVRLYQLLSTFWR